MENQLEKVFVKVNQRWQKANIINEEDGKVNVLTQDGQRFSMAKESKWLEFVQNPAQRYAYGDVKEQLENSLVSNGPFGSSNSRTCGAYYSSEVRACGLGCCWLKETPAPRKSCGGFFVLAKCF